MYQYLGNGLFLVQDWHQDSNFEPVDVEVLEDSHWARLDAVSRNSGKAPVSKAKCNSKPVKNAKGIVIRPATFPCGSVCRQKQNCGLSKSEKATIARRTKGLDEQELRKAIVVAKRKKRQGQAGAVYEATSKALGQQGKQRQEKRFQKSVAAAEKRAKSKSKAKVEKPEATEGDWSKKLKDLEGVGNDADRKKKNREKIEIAAIEAKRLRESSFSGRISYAEHKEKIKELAKDIDIEDQFQAPDDITSQNIVRPRGEGGWQLLEPLSGKYFPLDTEDPKLALAKAKSMAGSKEISKFLKDAKESIFPPPSKAPRSILTQHMSDDDFDSLTNEAVKIAESVSIQNPALGRAISGAVRFLDKIPEERGLIDQIRGNMPTRFFGSKEKAVTVDEIKLAIKPLLDRINKDKPSPVPEPKDKPQRKAVMDSLIKIPPPPAKKTRKRTMALLVARCLAEVKIDRALRQDSCRASCGECLRKHLGSAIVCAHEVAHGYPHHDLLVIGHLSEAEQESARDNPGLAEGIRSLRRKFQHGGGLDFDDVVELLQGSMDNPWTQQAYG